MSKQELKRELGLFDGFSILAGIMVGSGIFYIGSYVLIRSGMSQGLALAVWAIGGLITLISGLCYAELGAAMPETGGSYVYIKRAYGDLVAFASSFTGYILGACGSLAALSLALPLIMNNFISVLTGGAGMNDLQMKLVASVIIILLSAINYLGIRFGKLVQNIFTIAKFIPIVLIIVLGITMGTQNVDLSLMPVSNPSISDLLSMVALGVVATFWAYEGWKNLNTIAGEIKNPGRNLPWAIILAIVVVMSVYVIFNFAIYRVLSLEQITAQFAAGNYYLGTVVAQQLLGDTGMILVGLTMFIAVFGATNGCAMVFPRSIFALSENKMFFAPFAKVHPKYNTPGNAIILTGIISIALVFARNLDQMTNLVVFSGIIFSILLFISVFMFRKQYPDMPRPYKVWFYPVTPILAILTNLALLINTLITDFNTSMIGIVVTLASVPVYFIIKNLTKKD